MGCDVVELYCDVDGHFPHHHPDPSQPANLEDLAGNSLARAFDRDLTRAGGLVPGSKATLFHVRGASSSAEPLPLPTPVSSKATTTVGR